MTSSNTINRTTQVVRVGSRISRAVFRKVLEQANSPAAGEADSGYDLVVSYSVDPAFALAIFRHESQYGTRGICREYDTKNPGNVRTSRLGLGTVIETPRGRFVKFQSWAEGWRELAYRLVDPTFVYAQRNAITIEQIIPIWAPPADGNAPEAYIQSVVRSMNEYIAMESTPTSLTLSIPFRVDFIPIGKPNRPGLAMEPKYITVHETGNRAPGANAEMHRRFVHNGGGQENVSFHFVVDDREVIQLLPLTEIGWHAGDGYYGTGNRQSIAIEVCVNIDANRDKALSNLIELLAALLRLYGWSTNVIVQHNRWSGKNCPALIRAERKWEWLLEEVRRRMGAPMQSDERVYFPETGHWLAGGFRQFWLRHGGLPIFGYPLSEEYRGPVITGCGCKDDGKPHVVQWFERARFEWHPGAAPDRFDVLLGRIGAELAEKLQLTDHPAFVRR